jgi:hypothetical protein
VVAPSPRQDPSPQWPPNAKSSYRPSLIAAIAASAGVVIGSTGPWATVILFTINGLDTSWWGVTTLTAGALAASSLVLLLFWSRTTFAPRWSVPPAWLATVLGVCCFSMSLPFLIRLLTSPRTDFFGLKIGPGVGWGLWLLTVSSAVLAVAAAAVATHVSEAVERLTPLGQSPTSWTQSWRRAAIVASAVIVLTSILYFALNWEYNVDSDDQESTPSLPSFPSFTMPSFPDFTKTPTP